MNNTIQELEDRLKTVAENTPEKVDILNELAWKIRMEDRERASNLAKAGIRLAQKLNYQRGIAFGHRNLGIYYYFRHKHKRGMCYLLDALKWFEDNDDKEGIATTYSVLGLAYWSFGDFQRGFDSTFKALKIYREIEDKAGEAWTLNSLGSYYDDMKDYQNALSYYEKAYQLFKEENDLLGESRALNGIGNAFHFTGDNEKALQYQNESLDITRSIGNRLGESKTLNDIGLLYKSQAEYEKALEFHQKSLKLRRELGYPQGETTSLLDLGEIYMEQEEYERALELFQEALSLSEKTKANLKICRAHHDLSIIYEKLGQFEKALQHYQKYHEVDEEVFHEDTDEKIKNLQTVYQVESSQREAEIYRLKNVELKEKNDELEQALKKLQAMQAQLLQSGKMAALGNLVAGIAHEINNPTGTIKSAADVSDRGIQKLLNVLQSIDIPETHQNYRELKRTVEVLLQNNQNINDATKRIVRICKSLNSFTQLDKSEYQKTNINEGLESTLTLINHELENRIEVKTEFGTIPEIYGYPQELNQLFMNLLMNSVQAIQDKGTISIKTWADNGQVKVKISDTGKGIPREKIDELFEPGFTEGEARIKMRTGLYTSYNIVQKHHGEIKVDSRPGEGTSFIIDLPIEAKN